MLNTHDPDMVDWFVADEHRNHDVFVEHRDELNLLEAFHQIPPLGAGASEGA